MLNYNDDNIFVGYIKQLLSSFNYPDIEVYSYKITPVEGEYYLKDNNICLYRNEAFIPKINYTFNKSILNITKSFRNRSFIYDEETHIWLGKYLRFLRDYRNLNLMSMYNFFNNTLSRDVDIEETAYTFDSNDSTYKIYSIPIYFFEKYSIYLEATGKVEMVASFDKKTGIKGTYKRVIDPKFNTPIIFDYFKNLSNDFLRDNYSNRSSLRLIIKVPSTTLSSIVILEGEYPNSNDFTLSTDANYKQNNFLMKANYSVNNYEYIDEGLLNNHLKSPLELLYLNTGTSHPFANRLIEYLIDNTITPLDKVPDNIKRIQKLLQDRYFTIEGKKHLKLGMRSYGKEYGRWIPRMTNTLYDIEVSNNILGTTMDILGYVDKDVERQLGEDVDIYGGNDL